MKKANTSTILAGALALATFGIWSLSEYVNTNLSMLPVKRVPSKQQTAEVKPFDVKNLFPVWVASSTKTRNAASGEGSVDELFKGKEVKPVVVEAAPAPVPQAPDYAAMLPGLLHLESLSGTGGFINGKFYHVGEDMPDFEYPSRGRQIVPQLVEVRPRSVIVAHGGKRTEIAI